MTKQTRPLTKVEQVTSLMNNLNSEVGTFSCKRALQLAEEYEVTDPLNKDIYIYIQALSNLNLEKYDQALFLYKKVIHNSLKKHGDDIYIKFSLSYATVYYSIGKFFEAYEIIKILDAENLILKSNDIRDISNLVEIYFENNEFEKITNTFDKITSNQNYEKNQSKIPTKTIITLTAFSLYELGKYSELVVFLSKVNSNEKNNFNNLIPLLEKNLKNRRKKDLTLLESSSLQGIREILSLYNDYSLEQINFKDQISFNGKNYSILVEREPDWFYAEIIDMNKIRAAGLTLEELKSNLVETLKEYLEYNEKDKFYLPNKLTLKTIMETELGKNIEKCEDFDLDNLLEMLSK